MDLPTTTPARRVRQDERETIAQRICDLAERPALDHFFLRHPHLEGMNLDDLGAVLVALAEEIKEPPRFA